MGTGGFFPGIKKPGGEADHSPPSRTEVKKGGAIPPLSCKSLWYSAYIIKHTDNFASYG
jgi:hypothetical protein